MNQASYVLGCPARSVSSYAEDMRSLFMLVGIVWSGVAWSSPTDSDRFDPLLDERGSGPAQSRYQSPQTTDTGFTVSGGLYAGSVTSYLTEDWSTLNSGIYPSVGFGIGGRFDSPLEFGVNLDLGFGRTYEPETGENISAIDAHRASAALSLV